MSRLAHSQGRSPVEVGNGRPREPEAREAGPRPQAARRLVERLLADDRRGPAQLVTALLELRRRDGLQSFSEALKRLVHLEIPETRAEGLLGDVLAHRASLTVRLGRDPGLRVAAFDYLSNVERMLDDPAIVERAHLEQTERSALVDPLSGLYNRRHFVEALALELRRSRRYGLQMSVLMLDLDDFKPLNDERGHLFGDLVLKQVGQVLRKSVRDADSACRYGGDEFAVVLPETDRLGAHALAERVCRRVEERFRLEPLRGQLATVHVSGGIAAFPDDGTHATALVEAADRALYLSKAQGKNRISVYHDERRKAIRFRVRPRARFVLDGTPEAAPVSVEVLNLSALGVLLVAPPSFEGAAQLRLRCESGEGGAGWERTGRIVRVEPGSERGARLALAFGEPLSECDLERQVSRERSARTARTAVS